jgi:hypothetical protein
MFKSEEDLKDNGNLPHAGDNFTSFFSSTRRLQTSLNGPVPETKQRDVSGPLMLK